jgi:hypothetical protein
LGGGREELGMREFSWGFNGEKISKQQHAVLQLKKERERERGVVKNRSIRRENSPSLADFLSRPYFTTTTLC